MSLHIIHSDLVEAFRRLQQRWKDTNSLWNDPVRWKFEKEHWKPLERETGATLREMERLADVLAKARRNVRMP